MTLDETRFKTCPGSAKCTTVLTLPPKTKSNDYKMGPANTILSTPTKLLSPAQCAPRPVYTNSMGGEIKITGHSMDLSGASQKIN